MGTISSGIGLISGIDIQGLVDQLIAIEARPRTIVERRVALLQAQKTAFQSINARLLALETATNTLASPGLFNQKLTSSSDDTVVSATASNSAPKGTFNFVVDRLVSTHQSISRGFTDADTATLSAGTLRFDSVQSKLSNSDSLSTLNGGAGVQRGSIRITDRSGNSATVDLSRAVTVDDVLDAINVSADIDVTASRNGDGLLITDNTGAVLSDLIIQDIGTQSTASDLGIAGNSGGTNQVTGTDINTVGIGTALQSLNDGLGIRHGSLGTDDFNIQTDSGLNIGVSLSDIHNDGTNVMALTVGDVITAINTAAGGSVTASVGTDGVSLRIVDNTFVGPGTTTVTALSSSSAAADLQILTSDTDGDINGGRVISTLGSKLLRNLNGGTGITTPGTVSFTDRQGDTTTVDVSSSLTISEMINTINTTLAGAGVDITASVNGSGNGLLLTDTTGAVASNMIVADTVGSSAADLGLTANVAANIVDGGDRDLKYLSEATRLEDLNAGRGVARGRFTLTDGNGVTGTVDLTQGNEVTLGDVITEINSRPTGITAVINATGDGILLTDTTGGSITMSVEEDGSTTARDLGILGTATGATLDGSIEKAITIDAADTLNDLRDKINAANIQVTASVINDGSGVMPYRLILSSVHSGAGGEVVIDDGGAGLGFSTLVEAQDALVFFGSSDPTQALAITSDTNSLSDTIQGVTIDLHSTSTTAEQITINGDEQAIVDSASGLVTALNDVLDTLEEFDFYDTETKEKGLLFSDRTVEQIRQRLYKAINSTYEGLNGSFDFLSQVGIRVGKGARFEFDESKFQNAMAADPDGVKELMTAVSVTTVGSETTTTALGFGPKFQQLLEGLTDSFDGVVSLKNDTIDKQVDLANDRIEQLNKLLDLRRSRLEQQFLAMERALAQFQSQQGSIGSLASNFAATVNSGGIAI